MSCPRTMQAADFVARSPGCTSAEVGEALGVTRHAAHDTLRRAARVGWVHRVHDGRRVYWHSDRAPQADAPGLSVRLEALCERVVSLRALFAIAGVGARGVVTARRLDRPDAAKQLFTRSVGAASARRLAQRLRDRADELDAWADDAEAA